jgi:hypothetical protein
MALIYCECAGYEIECSSRKDMCRDCSAYIPKGIVKEQVVMEDGQVESMEYDIGDECVL